MDDSGTPGARIRRQPWNDVSDPKTHGEARLAAVPEMEKAFERQRAELPLLERKQEQAHAFVHAAKAELDAVQSEYERIKSLAETKAVTQRAADESHSRYESARAQLGVTEAAVKAAEASVLVAQKTIEEMDVLMGYASIKAPFAGVVTQRSVDPGDRFRKRERPANAWNVLQRCYSDARKDRTDTSVRQHPFRQRRRIGRLCCEGRNIRFTRSCQDRPVRWSPYLQNRLLRGA